jgi:hypothetical protein
MQLLNETQSALCDMYDIRRAIPEGVKKLPKDNEGTDYTVGECIDDVILFLEELETIYQGQTP